MRPASADEVAAVLAWCSASGVAVVPQGGNTGLVGGSVPDGSAPRSCCRCAGSTPSARSTPTPGQVTAGAGVTLPQVQRRGGGLRAGPSASTWAPARRATVGGMVATNAGGLHVVRHGAMRAQVLGRGGGARRPARSCATSTGS